MLKQTTIKQNTLSRRKKTKNVTLSFAVIENDCIYRKNNSLQKHFSIIIVVFCLSVRKKSFVQQVHEIACNLRRVTPWIFPRVND